MNKSSLGVFIFLVCSAGSALAADANPAVLAPQPVVLQPAAPMTAVAPPVVATKDGGANPAKSSKKAPAKKNQAKPGKHTQR